MIWEYLNIILIVFSTLWLVGILNLFIRKKRKGCSNISIISSGIAVLILLLYIITLWIQIDRPPLKTMAETRLWYSFFVSLVTLLIYLKTKSKPLYILGFVMSFVFLLVDIIHPEYISTELMPALQSPWFIPHVIIYMIAYAILASAWITTIIGLIDSSKNKSGISKNITLTMSLVYPGFALLSLGLIMGAFWAKIAWSDYWTWDAKETWALLTWLFYLICIHLHKSFPKKEKLLLYLLIFSFIVLIITWLGIRYFPSGANSIHVYG